VGHVRARLAWVGVFGHSKSGISRHEAVAVLQTPPVAYVVAAGKDYLIDHETRDLRLVYDDSTAEGVIAVPSLSRFVVWDSVKMQAVGADGDSLWLSHRISWDGIRDVRLEGSVVVGEAASLEDQWKGFRLEPENGNFTGGSYVSGPWDN
jgi:hypothetical protein